MTIYIVWYDNPNKWAGDKYFYYCKEENAVAKKAKMIEEGCMGFRIHIFATKTED